MNHSLSKMKNRILPFFRYGPSGDPHAAWVRNFLIAVFLIQITLIVYYSARAISIVSYWTIPALLSVLGLFQIVRRRRNAIEYLAWLALADLLLTRDRFPIDGAVWLRASASGVCCLLLLGLWKKAFVPGLKFNRWREAFAALRLSIALLLFLEVVASMATYHPAKRFQAEEVGETRPLVETFQNGNPTIITLGSSAAHTVQDSDVNFTRRLQQLLGDRFNFVDYSRPGTHSSELVRLVKMLADSEKRPDAFLIYAGHQDYLATHSKIFFKKLDLLAENDLGIALVNWLVRESYLVRYAMYIIDTRSLKKSRPAQPGFELTCLGGFQKNIQRIVRICESRDIHVFVITLVGDHLNLTLSRRMYIELVNLFLRNLPQPDSHVTLIDFENAYRQAYPQGRLSNCEPFWEIPKPFQRSGIRCGDPIHLNSKGHRLLAETIKPIIEQWAQR